ncbi:hypothetical protein QJS04_geneDACA009977 [Acorus gramineus]|uniref:PB1 domain-containing protein n=1 Tax=Acorus gramineus TaxID=55184 RepID=A0AAV9BG12_ACOGR|nr:hypothetical protein QJS04_geneDACA009977 [Acorus gramineus]
MGSSDVGVEEGGAAVAESEAAQLKFLCSHGGKILPRPSDGQLKYVGGETRVLAVPRSISYEELMKKIEQRYIDALNGVVSAPTVSFTVSSSADSSPKSATDEAPNNYNLTTTAATATANRNYELHRVHSSPNLYGYGRHSHNHHHHYQHHQTCHNNVNISSNNYRLNNENYQNYYSRGAQGGYNNQVGNRRLSVHVPPTPARPPPMRRYYSPRGGATHCRCPKCWGEGGAAGGGGGGGGGEEDGGCESVSIGHMWE